MEVFGWIIFTLATVGLSFTLLCVEALSYGFGGKSGLGKWIIIPLSILGYMWYEVFTSAPFSITIQ